MTLSVFDLFKIGIGPSSSHTVGPMRAAYDYISTIKKLHLEKKVDRIEIILYGSLSATGLGHGTDTAVLLGLMGFDPETIDTQKTKHYLSPVFNEAILPINQNYRIRFNYQRDMIFSQDALPYHPNSMTLNSYNAQGDLLYSNTYYSVGGGFIIDHQAISQPAIQDPQTKLPYPFTTAIELLALCSKHNMSISQIMMENEKNKATEIEVRQRILAIWAVMKQSIQNGLDNDGILPGGLGVKRRAKKLHQTLQTCKETKLIFSSFNAMEWVNLYALAVNEENASGGRVVTAPTNGASGIIPAVLYYYTQKSNDITEDDIVDFFLSAAAIGILCKLNASISGAEVGCQGEVGSACAMASAGLAEMFGGSAQQVENAAEIGLEHNLGLTCDPIGGLVQIPCIERNAIAAVKAINAAQMALRGDGEHFVSLDKVIHTMKETGKDMSEKYKETSTGGLAVNAIEC